MSHRTVHRAAAILLAILMMPGIAACREPFSPVAISADLVPEDVRISLDRKHISDVTWHVCQADWSGGMSLYAATYTLTTPDGFALRCTQLTGRPSDSKLNGVTVGTEIQDGQAFLGQTGSGGTPIIEGDDDPIGFTQRIYAGGYCFDSRATEIAAKTTEGREFRCPVTNGFWLIVVNDAIDQGSPDPVVERWAEITAKSTSGKVLYRLDLGTAR